MTTASRRPAYTLLEVLLAAAIAAMLMAALYAAMDVHLRYVQAGREQVDDSTLARALLARISSDVTGCLTPITATSVVTPSSSSAGASAASSASGTGSTAGAATGGATADTGGTTSLSAVTPFNGGVQGDNGQLTVWVSRVPKLATGSPGDLATADQQQLGSSDLHRITYWLATSGDGGLARQDLDRVTASDDDSQLPPYVNDEAKLVIAPEVTSLQFRYFDGTDWQDSWDGTTLGADGVTPMGPPRAVEITVGIRRPSADPNDPNAVQQFRHVVIIHAANGQSSASSDTTGMGTTP
jgi:Type II secretion system (T2SS), protein J/Prokaryotic N-terminal methylation motif